MISNIKVSIMTACLVLPTLGMVYGLPVVVIGLILDYLNFHVKQDSLKQSEKIPKLVLLSSTRVQYPYRVQQFFVVVSMVTYVVLFGIFRIDASLVAVIDNNPHYSWYIIMIMKLLFLIGICETVILMQITRPQFTSSLSRYSFMKYFRIRLPDIEGITKGNFYVATIIQLIIFSLLQSLTFLKISQYKNNMIGLLLYDKSLRFNSLFIFFTVTHLVFVGTSLTQNIEMASN